MGTQSWEIRSQRRRTIDVKKMISKVRGFVDRYKKEKWFRYLLIITILVILAVIVSTVDDIRHKDEKPPDSGEQSIVSDFIEDSAVHIMLICVIGGGIAYVKHADELKLKEKK